MSFLWYSLVLQQPVCLHRSFFDFFFQAEDGIRDLVRSRGLGDVYKRQLLRAGRGTGHADPLSALSRYEFDPHVQSGLHLRPVSYTHLTLPTIYSV